METKLDRGLSSQKTALKMDNENRQEHYYSMRQRPGMVNPSQ